MKANRSSLCSMLAAAAFCALPSALHAFDSGSRSPVAAPCSASIEAAAQAAVGMQGAASTQSGYRAQDVVIDPVLRKIWVRVADCNDSRRPLTLVPIAAPLATGSGAPSQSVAPTAIVAPVKPVIRRGDAVDVIVQSASMHMALHGKAVGEAAANAEVEVLLDGDTRSDDKPKHIRGIATAEHRVEVHL